MSKGETRSLHLWDDAADPPPRRCLRPLSRPVGAATVLSLVLATAVSLPMVGCGDRPESRTADLLLRGGPVLTMDDRGTEARAVAVVGGRIAWVGDEPGAAAWIGPDTEVVELAGRMLLPGFEDGHVHPVSGGVELAECNLNPMPDAASVLAGIAECAAADPDSPWLRGGGFQLPHFPGGKPTAAMLDAIERERPVWLTSADGHSAWVNSEALRIAGITAATPDPPMGRIERDPATGEPSGTLREAAMDLVGRHLPDRTPEQYADGLRRALAMAAELGVTGMQEASASRNELEAYAALRDAGELTAHVSISLWVDPERGVEQVPELVALREEFEGGGLRVAAAKIFADGVLEGQTAALLEPYVGMGEFAGELNFEPEALEEIVAALDAAGFQVHVHAIGDRAIRVTLDAFEHARTVNGVRDSRHHIVHTQLIDPADIPRFAELDVTANFQPLWAWADSYITELTEPFLGPERSRWLYPMASVAAAGGRLVFGSDWSVSSMNPLPAIEVGMTRSDPEGGPGRAWIPEERLDLETMLAGYTRGAAWINFLERDTGTIEVGKLADLVVLDRDLRRVEPHEIGEVGVDLTLFSGTVIARHDT